MTVENPRSEQSSPKKPSDLVETTTKYEAANKTAKANDEIARPRATPSHDTHEMAQSARPIPTQSDAVEIARRTANDARAGAKHIAEDARNVALDSLRNATDNAFDSLTGGVEQMGMHARRVGHGVSDFVAAHAIPLAMVGAGAGWLLVSMSQKRRFGASPRYAGRYDDTFAAVRERADELTSRAGEALARAGHQISDRAADLQTGIVYRAGELRSQVVEGASEVGKHAATLGRQAYDGVERVGSRAAEFSEQNPLTIGLVALAAGVSVAMLLPATRRENALLGKSRDQLVDRAKHAAEELKSSVERSASDVREVIDEIRHPGSGSSRATS